MARLEGLVEAEWIGQGKKYDMQNLPNSVSEAKAHYLLTIPNAFSDIIPDDIDNVPLSQSLQLQLLIKSTIKVGMLQKFSPAMPCIDEPKQLTSGPIPSDHILLHLENGLGECATMVIGLGFGCWHIGVVGKVVPAKMGHCTR
ncbi:hypothetical protein JOM56_003674 [Amanita muscaria]